MGPTRPSSPRVSRTSEASAAGAPVLAAMRTGGVEPPQPGATRLQRGELSRAQRPQVSSAGGIRTHGLELMRLARTAPPLPREVWLAGVEPAISGAQNRRDGLSPTARGTGRGPGGARKVDDRGIEPRFTAVSERRLPSRPVVDLVGGDRNSANADFRSRKSLKPAAVAAGSLRQHIVDAEASPGIRTLLAGITARGLASSRATQSRREDSNPRTPR